MVVMKFENDVPISDVLEALGKLVEQYYGGNFRARRRLITRRNDRDAPYIKVCYSRDFSYDTFEYYKVTPELVDELRAGGYVEGTPHWGYTDDDELAVTEHGIKVFLEDWRRQKAAESAQKAESEKGGETGPSSGKA